MLEWDTTRNMSALLCPALEAWLDAQKVLLWISLVVLMLVTGGMAIIQHIHETDSRATLWDHFSDGKWQYSMGRAVFTAVAFFFVSFLTAPAPGCLVPGSGIPSNAAWIVAVLLGSILALAALYLPPRTGSDARRALEEPLNGPANPNAGP